MLTNTPPTNAIREVLWCTTPRVGKRNPESSQHDTVRVVQRVEKDLTLDLIRQKNKVASFCSLKDHDSFLVNGGNSRLSSC